MPVERFSPGELRTLSRLNTPPKVQDFLATLEVNFETRGDTVQSPRVVLRSRSAHCMEGALLAAAALELHGFPPLVMDLRSSRHDVDHVVALFRLRGCWGAVGKTNHAVLRYREPVYRTLRELALSYFHEYFLDSGKKTLREYSAPVNLKRFNGLGWRTSEKDLFEIPEAVDDARHYRILTLQQIKNLRKADPIEIQAGKLVEWKSPAPR